LKEKGRLQNLKVRNSVKTLTLNHSNHSKKGNKDSNGQFIVKNIPQKGIVKDRSFRDMVY